ncbi:MAG: hypothetical protein HC924_00325 [Synechococcaceae cyanobacterium SM2_3_2]|nr:hypothetical protein [Synechococcaceae cyanobacterium SM2_3_2]
MSTITAAPPNLGQTLLEHTYQIREDPQSLYALLNQHTDQLPHLSEEIRHWS